MIKQLQKRESDQLMDFGDKLDAAIMKSFRNRKGNDLTLNISLEGTGKDIHIDLQLHADLYSNLSSFITNAIHDAFSLESMERMQA